LYWIIKAGIAVLIIVLSLCLIRKNLVLVSTSFIGAYFILKSLDNYLSLLPSETLFYKLIINGEKIYRVSIK